MLYKFGRSKGGVSYAVKGRLPKGVPSVGLTVFEDGSAILAGGCPGEPEEKAPGIVQHPETGRWYYAAGKPAGSDAFTPFTSINEWEAFSSAEKEVDYFVEPAGSTTHWAGQCPVWRVGQ